MSRPGYDDVVLLTGLPGLRARHVLRELVRAPRTHVIALVTAEERSGVEASLDGAAAARVDFLEGDASAMDLGLSGAELRVLAATVDRIHHVAIATDPATPKAVAVKTNVGAAREILELAEMTESLRALVFHSSVTVSGQREGLVLEDDPVPREGFRNDAEETMARAERMMREATKVPVVVARAGLVVGDSTTGEFDGLEGFYLLVLLIMTSPREIAIPLPSRGDAPLHLVPVDYVARAACALGRDARAVGRTVHLVDPSPLSARRVLELVAQATGRRMGPGFLPANVTKALLNVPGIDRLARSPRAVLDALVSRVTYGREAQAELLAGTGVTCPPFEQYVETLVDAVRRRQGERQERRDAHFDDPLG